jgi:hypothetical protein
MAIDPITAVLNVGSKLLDKFIADPAEKAKAKAALLQMAQDGDLKELEVRMSAILAEAKSADPWTSRARPSFLYVMYAMILAAVPMGVLHAYNPVMAVSIAEGMRAWLAALPDELWWLFGAGYLGYTGARSLDKRGKLDRFKG